MAESHEALALRVARGVTAHDNRVELPTQRDVTSLEHGLTVWLGSRLPGIGVEKRAEYAGEAVQRFLIAASQGRVRVDSAGEPAAYLRQTARNLALDEAKSPRARAEPLNEAVAAEGDQALLRMFDRAATRARIVQGIRRSWDEADGTSVRVMMEWIRLAESDGEAPSNRAVAASLGMSHTAVNDALERFRNRL